MIKHRDLIIKWANGAEIQYFDFYTNEWIDSACPSWDDITYRINPRPVEDDALGSNGCWDYYTARWESYKLSIKVTFGEDNLPIKVELIDETN